MTVIRDQVVLFYTGVGYHQTYILDIDDRECRQWLKRQKVVYGGIMVGHKFVKVSDSLFKSYLKPLRKVIEVPNEKEEIMQ